MRNEATCGRSLYWYNCYSGGFDLIAPDSYAHPAKMAPSLCYRILDHLKELGLLKDSDTILDPMGGTGMTAICAGAKGYKAITTELEEKFIGFQQQNKDYAAHKLYHDLDWQILQGDARKLSDLLNERGLVSLTSPPYAEAQSGGGIAVDGYQGTKHSPTDLVGKRSYMPETHGITPGQIGNMKDTSLKVVTSPPYAGHVSASNSDPHPEKQESTPAGRQYGQAPGQIGQLPDKTLKTLTSPPYGDAMGDWKNRDASGAIYKGEGAKGEFWYGQGSDNIGNLPESLDPGEQTKADWWRRKALGEAKETYLEAMKIVYQEIAKVSDVLAIVLKNPTRNGKLRRLDLDTIELLKQSGWTIHCQHQALLFEELEQGDMFNGSQKKIKGRMSFFKRLSWQNGQPVASWEDVIIAVRKYDTPDKR